MATTIGQQTRNAAFRIRYPSRLDVVRDGTIVEHGLSLRLNPSAYYYYGPFGALVEYFYSSRELDTTRVPATARDFEAYQNHGWTAQATYVLTGEDATYGDVNPKNPFNLSNGAWGAWEIAVRYTGLRIDCSLFDDGLLLVTANGNAQKADTWSAGLNWYLTRNFRSSLCFDQTFYSGLGGDRQTDSTLISRLQLAF